jgi:lipopolysaccharide transport system ATP-binding protein
MMSNVASCGRTVLFVSHNMSAVAHLCSKAMWIADGQQRELSDTLSVISNYIHSTPSKHIYVDKTRTDKRVQLTSLVSRDSAGHQKSTFHANEDVYVSLRLMVQDRPSKFRTGIRINKTNYGTIFTSCDTDSDGPSRNRAVGEYQITCKIPKLLLSPGMYTVTAAADVPMLAILFEVEDAISFEISEVGAVGSNISDGRLGIIRPLLTWQEQCISSRELESGIP